MATILSALRTDIRDRLVEESADFYSDADLLRAINFGYRKFVQRSEYLDKIKVYPTVANQYEYALPSDHIKTESIFFQDKWKIEPLDLDEFWKYMGTGNAGTEQKPKVYREFPVSGKFRVFPIPNATSEATTVSGVHNTSVTTIAVADATDFPEFGRIIINDSEQVHYYDKSGNNLLQCVRGDGNTTAASYTGGETVKLGDMHFYYRYLPPDLSADGDATHIPTQYDEAIIFYAVGTCLMKRERPKEARVYFDFFNEECKRAMEERLKQTRDKYWYIKDESYEDLG